MPPAALWSDAFWQAVDPVVGTVGYFAPEPGWCGTNSTVVLPDFDLWCVLDGRGEILLDGRWHRFSAGQLLTLKPGQEFQHERTVGGGSYLLYYAHLLPFGSASAAFSAPLAAAWPMILPVGHLPELGALFAQLFAAYATRPGEYSLAVKGIALQLLGVIFEELRAQPALTQPLSHPRVLRAREFIEANYAHDLALRDIARDCGLSPAHLCVLFRRQFGRSPIEYLIQVRLQKAKVLLARGLAVREVAEQVGVHSQHYFARLFRQKIGETPSEFAASYRRL